MAHDEQQKAVEQLESDTNSQQAGLKDVGGDVGEVISWRGPNRGPLGLGWSVLQASNRHEISYIRSIKAY